MGPPTISQAFDAADASAAQIQLDDLSKVERCALVYRLQKVQQRQHQRLCDQV
jgi:hypothetical protein